MKMKNLILDTSDLTFEELDDLIQRLRTARARKGEARARHQNLCSLIENAKDDNLVFCSRHTGEVLNPNDWVVYDNLNHCAYPETNEEE